MATTTPNYGWAVPTSTDLVKDGATAIETLGDAIDASMNTALGTKKAGMVLLNTTSFSAVSSISLPANTFSATYNTYTFTFDLEPSTGNQLLGRLRAAGVDNSSTNYTRANWEAIPINTSRDTGQTSIIVGEFNTSLTSRPLTFTLCDPQVSGRYTSAISHGMTNINGNVYPIVRFHGVNVTTSYDSMTFLTSTGTITGSISCYGFNE
jgi:hypothetical protein